MTSQFAVQRPQTETQGFRAPCDTAQCKNECPYAYSCSRRTETPALFIAWPAMALIALVAVGALL